MEMNFDKLRHILGIAVPPPKSIGDLQIELDAALAAKMELALQLAQIFWDRDEWRDLCGKRTAALHQIAARVTAKPNAASREMARIAREALE
jgi:hypothetical protein